MKYLDFKINKPTQNASSIRVELKPSRKLNKFIHFIQLHRILSLCLAILIFLSLLIPIVDNKFSSDRYKVSSAVDNLLGSTSPKLAKKVSYDAKQELYEFNKEDKKQEGSAPTAPTDPSISAGDHGYSADLPKDPSKGVKIYDNVNNLSVSFTPNFKTLAAKQDTNRFIYPISSKPGQMVYTAKANGIKEDIILSKYKGDKLSFSYKLGINSDLEARLTPNGDVGIYSADPTLYGNISFGSDQDREKVEQARTNGKKDNLVFFIPAPVIKQSGESKGNPSAKFKLDKNTLTIETDNLKTANYPLSIDPTFIVTSASDWNKGNNEGGVDTSGNDLIRSGLTGGTVGSWGTAQSTTGPLAGHTMHVRTAGNGNTYVYVVAGLTAVPTTTVEYALIDGQGNVGKWAITSSLNATRYFHSSAIVGNYMYAVGGANTAALLNSVEFASFNNDGTLSSWTTTSSFATARYIHTATSNAGYLYLFGGCSNPGTGIGNFGTGCLASQADVQYAKPNGDGTIPASGAGAWAATTSMPANRFGNAVGVYNDRVYIRVA